MLRSTPILTQLRTLSQGKLTPRTVKDHGWADYFDRDVESRELEYWCPMSESYKKKHKCAYGDMVGTLSWRWARLPDGDSIAWEATTDYLRTSNRASTDRPCVHPFRLIPTPFIQRADSCVSIGTVVPISAETLSLLDRLIDIKDMDQADTSSLIHDLQVKDHSRPRTLSKHGLNEIGLYLNWTLARTHVYSPDLERDNIRMMACARIFRRLFEQRVIN